MPKPPATTTVVKASKSNSSGLSHSEVQKAERNDPVLTEIDHVTIQAKHLINQLIKYCSDLSMLQIDLEESKKLEISLLYAQCLMTTTIANMQECRVSKQKDWSILQKQS